MRSVITINADLRSAACRKPSRSPAKRRSWTCRPARAHADGDRQRGRSRRCRPRAATATSSRPCRASRRRASTRAPTRSMNFFTARGGRGNEGTIQIDGMNVGSAFNGGGVAGFGYDTANATEIQVTVAGGLGEADRGGPAVQHDSAHRRQQLQRHRLPQLRRRVVAGRATSTTSCAASASPRCPGLIKNWDTNFALGGPIKRDRLWFFGNVRSFGQHTDVPGLYGNTNAGNPARGSTCRTPSLKARNANAKMIDAIRLTGQLTPKNKLGLLLRLSEELRRLVVHARTAISAASRGDDWVALGAIGGFGSDSPESGNSVGRPREDRPGDWTSTGHQQAAARGRPVVVQQPLGRLSPGAGARPELIPVTELIDTPATACPVPIFTYRGRELRSATTSSTTCGAPRRRTSPARTA